MNNPVKMVLGSLLGAGIAMGISKLLESDNPRTTLLDDPSAKESFRERVGRARSAGQQAKVDRQAELRSFFREKVNDPSALPEKLPS